MVVARARGVMIAATRQHVGKTTTSLAIMNGVQKRFGRGRVGFIKPVGQRHVLVEDAPGAKPLKVDKDVTLFKRFFKLDNLSYAEMSPVVIPSGYTRAFLDGAVTEEEQVRKIRSSYDSISAKCSDFVVVEGTGHCGVGSVVGLDNARVASLLGLEMVLVVNGGLGAAFDELALNRLMCIHHDVKIKGVLVNKVKPEKLGMIEEYFAKALKRWDIPLLGVVPDASLLSMPTMLDFESLFDAKVMSGEESRLNHFDRTTLVAMGLKSFMERVNDEQHSKTLFVTHASRADIVLGFIAHGAVHQQRWGVPFKAGLIVAGEPPGAMPESLLSVVKAQKSPILHARMSTYDAMVQLTNYTAKLSALDVRRTTAAIRHYEPYIDFDQILA